MSENDADRQQAVSATGTATIQCALINGVYDHRHPKGYCGEWDMKPAYH